MDNMRQPKPVTISFSGDPLDIQYYAGRIRSIIENSSYDNVEKNGPATYTIYPAARND